MAASIAMILHMIFPDLVLVLIVGRERLFCPVFLFTRKLQER